MKAVISTEGDLSLTTERDAQLMKYTVSVDEFLEQRKKEGLFHEIGIAEKCLLTGFVMWLSDNNKIDLK